MSMQLQDRFTIMRPYIYHTFISTPVIVLGYASFPQLAKPRPGISHRLRTTSLCLSKTPICLSPRQCRIVLSADAAVRVAPTRDTSEEFVVGKSEDSPY